MTTASPLAIRRATVDDRERLWRWANDPGTRSASFNSAPIPYEDHLAWFARKVRSARDFLFVVETAARDPVAAVRFEVEGEDAEVSLVVDPRRRGTGLGAVALDLGCVALAATGAARRAVAHIKPDNEASQRAFVKAGFAPAGAVEFAGQPALRYTRELV